MAKATAKFGNRNSICLKVFLAMLFLLQLSASAAAHDFGISSIDLRFSGERLVICSNYAGAEIERDILGPVEISARESFSVNIDGKVLKPSDFKIVSTRSDGIVFEHMFERISGSKIKLVSELPPKLSPGHTQILTVTRDDGREISRQILKGDFSFVLNLKDLRTPNAFGQFLTLGIGHILYGFDHLLFLLALLLVIRSRREMIGIITFFTLAHSITLSLVALDLVQIPRLYVEPLIAVSIIYVGAENLLRGGHKNRWLIAYAFGLVHGLGFAAALRETGIGTGTEALVPLLSFNLGVEIGQIAFALIILPLIALLRKISDYESRLVPAISVLISLAGVYWLIERVFY